MANTVETLDASSPIKSPADKFYDLFRFNTSDIVKIFPLGFKEITLLEGEQGQDGSIILWKYVIGGITLTAKTRVGIDEAAKSISFNIIEGDALLVYKSLMSALTVSDGFAKWTLSYEKSTLLSPPPELYVPLIVTMTTLVDAYLLLN